MASVSAHTRWFNDHKKPIPDHSSFISGHKTANPDHIPLNLMLFPKHSVQTANSAPIKRSSFSIDLWQVQYYNRAISHKLVNRVLSIIFV